MVKCSEGKKCSKHAQQTGEPPAKKHCAQLGEKQSKFSITFNGTKDANENNSANGSSGNEAQAKAVKRLAPQDDLSAKVYQYRFF